MLGCLVNFIGADTGGTNIDPLGATVYQDSDLLHIRQPSAF